MMHLSTSYTRLIFLYRQRCYQTSRRMARLCSATCASSVRASTNAGETSLVQSMLVLQGFLFMQLPAQMPLKLSHLKGIWTHPYAVKEATTFDYVVSDEVAAYSSGRLINKTAPPTQPRIAKLREGEEQPESQIKT